MLHVSLLGEQTIADGQTGIVRLRSSRTVALLGFLASHAGSPQTRQRIAGLFWPDSTDAQALTNLRRELHTLRHVLGDEPSLVVTSRDLCWQDSATCRVDLRTFDIERKAALSAAESGDSAGILAHAAEAISQYQGDFLPGNYDDWLIDLRSVYERQCADLCDLLGKAQEETGDLAAAVDTARRRVQLQPLEEVGYRALMRLQADLGDRAGALSTYHHCASVLDRELGVDPDAATRDTLQRLMARVDGTGAAMPAAEPAARRPGWASASIRRPVAGARPAPGRVADRCRGATQSRAGPRRGGRREELAWSPRSRSWRGSRVRSSQALSASLPPGDWRWHRLLTGCATRPCGPGRRASTRPGGPR